MMAAIRITHPLQWTNTSGAFGQQAGVEVDASDLTSTQPRSEKQATGGDDPGRRLTTTTKPHTPGGRISPHSNRSLRSQQRRKPRNVPILFSDDDVSEEPTTDAMGRAWPAVEDTDLPRDTILKRLHNTRDHVGSTLDRPRHPGLDCIPVLPDDKGQGSDGQYRQSDG